MKLDILELNESVRKYRNKYNGVRVLVAHCIFSYFIFWRSLPHTVRKSR